MVPYCCLADPSLGWLFLFTSSNKVCRLSPKCSFYTAADIPVLEMWWEMRKPYINSMQKLCRAHVRWTERQWKHSVVRWVRVSVRHGVFRPKTRKTIPIVVNKKVQNVSSVMVRGCISAHFMGYICVKVPRMKRCILGFHTDKCCIFQGGQWIFLIGLILHNLVAS